MLLSLGGCDTQDFDGYDLSQYAFLPSAVDADPDRVYVTVTGPSDRVLGVRLAATAMDKTYALVIFNDSVMMERRLRISCPVHACNRRAWPSRRTRAPTDNSCTPDGQRTAYFGVDADGAQYFAFPKRAGSDIVALNMAHGALAQFESDDFEVLSRNGRNMHHGITGHYQYAGDDCFMFVAAPTSVPTAQPTPSLVSDADCARSAPRYCVSRRQLLRTERRRVRQAPGGTL